VDLTGQAKLRWPQQAGGLPVSLRIVLKLADGKWLVSDQHDAPRKTGACANSTSPTSAGAGWTSRP